eukprot:7378098-Prymnesium_polylepis.1
MVHRATTTHEAPARPRGATRIPVALVTQDANVPRQGACWYLVMHRRHRAAPPPGAARALWPPGAMRATRSDRSAARRPEAIRNATR